MRHIGTLIAAVVIGPLAWVMLAFGQDRSADAFANASLSGAFHTEDFVRPLLLLAGAGLLLGLLGTLRFSPLGATVIGIGYTSSYTLLLVAPTGLLDLLTNDLSVAGRHADLTTPIQTGTTLVLGMLLLAAGISTGRWRHGPPPASTSETAAMPGRPLDVDGFGPTTRGQRTEPDLAARYAMRPEPGEANSETPGWSSSAQSTGDYYRW
jgi:hypothetical protein